MTKYVKADMLEYELEEIDFRVFKEAFVLHETTDGHHDFNSLRDKWYNARYVYNRFVELIYHEFGSGPYSWTFWIKVDSKEKYEIVFFDTKDSYITAEMDRGKWTIDVSYPQKNLVNISSIYGLMYAVSGAREEFENKL
uniref:Uncharacterized protein n=1 Tax=Ochrobactrum phage ORM_20 TaxID=2985243 RepID=A0A9N6WWX4_9VIRU|nr:hypothetical protein ORM20_00252 [Ochrobactrum phage ORM_20]